MGKFKIPPGKERFYETSGKTDADYEREAAKREFDYFQEMDERERGTYPRPSPSITGTIPGGTVEIGERVQDGKLMPPATPRPEGPSDDELLARQAKFNRQSKANPKVRPYD